MIAVWNFIDPTLVTQRGPQGNGEQVPNFIDTGVVLATKDNIDHPSVQNVLY